MGVGLTEASEVVAFCPTQCFQSGLRPFSDHTGWLWWCGWAECSLPKCTLPLLIGGVLLHSVKQLYFSGPGASDNVCPLFLSLGFLLLLLKGNSFPFVSIPVLRSTSIQTEWEQCSVTCVVRLMSPVQSYDRNCKFKTKLFAVSVCIFLAWFSEKTEIACNSLVKLSFLLLVSKSFEQFQLHLWEGGSLFPINLHLFWQ